MEMSEPGRARGLNPGLAELQPGYSHNHGDDTAFGPLDPFNFLVNDLEDVDWSVFDLLNA